MSDLLVCWNSGVVSLKYILGYRDLWRFLGPYWIDRQCSEKRHQQSTKGYEARDDVIVSCNQAECWLLRCNVTSRSSSWDKYLTITQHARHRLVGLRLRDFMLSSSFNRRLTEGSCRVSGFPEGFDECVAETLLHIILSAILRCDNPSTPAKRARFDCVRLQLILFCIFDKSDRYIVQDTADLGLFETPRKLWMSRRTLRKKWSAMLGSEERFPLLIEALVRGTYCAQWHFYIFPLCIILHLKYSGKPLSISLSRLLVEVYQS